MRLSWWMLVHEARIQLRSNRFRVLVTLYLALTIAAPIALHLSELRFVRRFGPGLWGACVEASLPFFSLLLAWVLAGDAILREKDENSFLVASLGAGSNAAYLAARWLAVTVVMLLVTLVPLSVALVLGVRSTGPPAAIHMLLQWVASVLPLVAMGTALSMGVSTIVGSTVGGTIGVLFGGAFGLAILQTLIARLGRNVDGALDWIRLEPPIEFLATILSRWSPPDPLYSDALPDWRVHFELALPRAIVICSLSLFAIVAATAFLRRSSPNLRVWRIRETHPLRTYLAALRSVFHHLKPDAGLQRREWLAIIASGALVVLSFATVSGLDTRWRGHAEARAGVERSGWPEPSGPELVVERVRVSGSIDPAEGFVTDVALVVRNEGETPIAKFAAELNPELVIEPVSSGLTIEKRWNRLEIRRSPAMEAGERAELRFRIRGVPSMREFAGHRDEDFPTWFEGVKATDAAMYVPDFSRSVRRRQISSKRVDVGGSSIFPVPRQAPWDGHDQSVQIAEIEVDLATSGSIVLATSCGDVSEDSDGGSRLRTGCSGELRDFSIAGARWVRAPLGESVELVCLEAHEENGRRRAEELTAALAEARRRWPEIPRTRTVIAEVPDEQSFAAARWLRSDGLDADAEPTIDGSMIRVAEKWLAAREDVDAGDLVIALRSQALLARRTVDPSQAYFFRYFYGALSAVEMGHPRESGAVLGQSERIAVPILNNDSWPPLFEIRLPAVVEALRHRVGMRVLSESVAEFLASTGTAPANAGDLFEILERRSGLDLDRFFDDFVAGGDLPQLQLADVTFVRQGQSWRVDGAVVNEGRGLSACEVVLRTEVGTQVVEVEVDSDATAAFHFDAAHRPTKVELDPNRKCFRWEPKGTLREVSNKAGRT